MDTYDVNWCDDDRGPYKARNIIHASSNTMYTARGITMHLEQYKWDLLWNEVVYHHVHFDYYSENEDDSDSELATESNEEDLYMTDYNGTCFERLVKNHYAYT